MSDMDDADWRWCKRELPQQWTTPRDCPFQAYERQMEILRAYLISQRERRDG